MVARLGFWLMLGLGVGLVNAISIVYTVASVTRHDTRRVRSRVVKRYLGRYLLALLAMTAAIHQDVAACASVGLGILLARWFVVWLGTSDRVSWSRLV